MTLDRVLNAIVATVLLGLGVAVFADPSPRPVEYSRSQFGTGWSDADHDGCDTREELLAAPGPCPPRARMVVITDPYTGQQVTGRENIDGDHIVALRWIWDHGAAQWTRAKRIEFANDIHSVDGVDNVILTDDQVNRRKSDHGPSEWLPPDRSRWCWYADRWVRVLAEYGVVLPAGDPDARALADIQHRC